MSNLHESSPSESSELMRVPTGVELVRQVESGLGLVKEVLRESQAEYWFDQAREIFDSDITEIHYRSFEVIRDGEVFDDWTELSGECLKYILTKEALDKCLKLNENHIRALLFRAEWFIYFSQNEEALSINDLDRALAIDPNNIQAYQIKSNAYSELLDPKSALVSDEKLVELDPCAYSYVSRGVSKRDLNDLIGAESDFNTALLLEPDSYTTLSLRGGTRYLLKNYTGSLKDYDDAIEMCPYIYWYYRGRADAKRAMGDLIGAQADFAKAAELERQAKQQAS